MLVNSSANLSHSSCQNMYFWIKKLVFNSTLNFSISLKTVWHFHLIKTSSSYGLLFTCLDINGLLKNRPLSSSSHEDNMPKISHCWSIYTLPISTTFKNFLPNVCFPDLQINNIFTFSDKVYPDDGKIS